MMTIEHVERWFQRLASTSPLGQRTAMQGLPVGREVAASPLVLREFMRHRDYRSITFIELKLVRKVRRAGLAHSGCPAMPGNTAGRPRLIPTLLSMTDPVPWDRSPLCARTEVRYRQLYRHHLTRSSRVPRLGYPLETPTTSNVAANIPDQRPMTVLARCFGEHLTVVAAHPTVSNFSGRHLCINRIAAKLLGMPNRSHRHPFEGRQRSERRRSAAALDRLWTANTRPSSRG
jgi:hypothetical protein